MNSIENEPAEQRLAVLRAEHLDLDSKIQKIGSRGNDTEIRQLKRAKLRLKDQIVQLEEAISSKK